MTINKIEKTIARALADSDYPEEEALSFLEEISENFELCELLKTRGEK